MPRSSTNHGTDEKWRMVRNRLIGYLDAAGCPPKESLEMSLQVIDAMSEKFKHKQTAHLFEAALNAARKRLKVQNRIEGDNCLLILSSDIFQQNMPEPTPGVMKPEILDGNPNQRLMKQAPGMIKAALDNFIRRFFSK